MCVLSGHLEGDIVGSIALDLQSCGTQVVEVLVQKVVGRLRDTVENQQLAMVKKVNIWLSLHWGSVQLPERQKSVQVLGKTFAQRRLTQRKLELPF